MSLQVRLRHALGERVIDLDDRTASRPLVVGRAATADVKVPSTTVAQQHCALFLHEGQWVLQDASGGATFLNGAPIGEPTLLHIGDQIVLGSDARPVVIDIDPAAAAQGRTGQPALGQTPPRQTSQAASRTSRSGSAASQPSGRGSYDLAPPPQIADLASAAQAAAEADPFAAMGQSVSGPTSASAPRARKSAKQTSDLGIMIGIGAVVLIAGITGWIAYVLSQKHEEAVAPPPVVAAPVHHDSIFYDEPNTPAKPKAAAQAPPKASDDGASAAPATAAPVAAATPTAAATEAPTAQADAPADDTDPAWGEVEVAHYSPEYGRSILKFDDYQRQNPGKHAAVIEGYVSETVDRLWCKHLVALCTRRVDLQKQIHVKDNEIRQEPSADFKKELTDKKAEMEKELTQVEATLADEIGYTSDEVPDMSASDAMAKLTSARDVKKFEAWKKRALGYIRKNHGATPWDGE